jgi:hypothetical protein
LEVLVREEGGKTRSVDIELTGHENARDLLNILGLDPEQHKVKAGRRTLAHNEIVPPHDSVMVEEGSEGEGPQIRWNELTSQHQDKIALTLATHFARNHSRVVSLEVKSDVTPHQLADTLVKRFGGINPNDVTQMVDQKGRNLAEPRYRNLAFRDLGVRSGETLDIQGDITQGVMKWSTR